MISIGVRDLKNQLSHFLRRVQAGESVLVTDHGRVVAELRQAEGALQGQRLPFAALTQAGAIRLPTVAGDPLADFPAKVARTRNGLARALIDEDRGEPSRR
jgi:antitoxin (DNA-binding transcriptional repressor) of toxin-antitoxin stability system